MKSGKSRKLKTYISCVVFILGLFLIIGTAGATDFRNISFIQAVLQAGIGLAMMWFGLIGFQTEE